MTTPRAYWPLIGVVKTYTGEDFNRTSHHNLFEFQTMTVQFLDLDWGPATKVLAALLLEHDQDTIIITFDDDIVYSDGTVTTTTTATVKWLASHINNGMALSFGCEMWNSIQVHSDFMHTLRAH